MARSEKMQPIPFSGNITKYIGFKSS